jgi:hypothetical protein
MRRTRQGEGVDRIKNRSEKCEGPGRGSSTGALCTGFTLVTNDATFDLKDLLGLNSHVIKPMCVSFLHGF